MGRNTVTILSHHPAVGHGSHSNTFKNYVSNKKRCEFPFQQRYYTIRQINICDDFQITETLYSSKRMQLFYLLSLEHRQPVSRSWPFKIKVLGFLNVTVKPIGSLTVGHDYSSGVFVFPTQSGTAVMF